jgi:hypothetical protein
MKIILIEQRCYLLKYKGRHSLELIYISDGIHKIPDILVTFY